jgi:HlyD family secretion protein
MRKLSTALLLVVVVTGGSYAYRSARDREDDTGAAVLLLATVEEEPLVLSFARAGRITKPVPEEGSHVQAGATVAVIEEVGLAEDIAGLTHQIEEVQAKETVRAHEAKRLRALLAQAEGDEARSTDLASQGIAHAAEAETRRHEREAVSQQFAAVEAARAELAARASSLTAQRQKLRRFQDEAVLKSPISARVLTRHKRAGEWTAVGEPVVTLESSAPYLRVEVPEERLRGFALGASVLAWPQTRPGQRQRARVVSVRPRAEYATRKDWGIARRDLKTLSVRLRVLEGSATAGETWCVEAGR